MFIRCIKNLLLHVRPFWEHLLMPSKVAHVATTLGTENNGIDEMKTPEMPSYIKHPLWI